MSVNETLYVCYFEIRNSHWKIFRWNAYLETSSKIFSRVFCFNFQSVENVSRADSCAFYPLIHNSVQCTGGAQIVVLSQEVWGTCCRTQLTQKEEKENGKTPLLLFYFFSPLTPTLSIRQPVCLSCCLSSRIGNIIGEKYFDAFFQCVFLQVKSAFFLV